MKTETGLQLFSFATIRLEEFHGAVSDIALLEKSLADADIVPRLLVHAKLSGDASLLSQAPLVTRLSRAIRRHRL
jgi:hypothetical protein